MAGYDPINDLGVNPSDFIAQKVASMKQKVDATRAPVSQQVAPFKLPNTPSYGQQPTTGQTPSLNDPAQQSNINNPTNFNASTGAGAVAPGTMNGMPANMPFPAGMQDPNQGQANNIGPTPLPQAPKALGDLGQVPGIQGSVSGPSLPPGADASTTQGTGGLSVLGQKIKAKYPQYSGMSDEELGQKILTKYPQYQSIVDEGNKQSAPQQDATVPEEGQPSPELNNIIGTVGGVGLGTAGALGAVQQGGAGLRKAGQAIYSTTVTPTEAEAKAMQSYKADKAAGKNVTKPTTAVDTALAQPSITKNPGDVLPGSPMIGTPSGIGTDAKVRMNSIFDDTMTPLFKEADKKGIVVPVQTPFQKAIADLHSDPKFKGDDTAMKPVEDAITDLWDNYRSTAGKSFSLQGLQNAKANIVGVTSKKALSGKITPSDAQMAKKYVGDAMRDTLHDTVQKEFGTNSADLFKEYGNLSHFANAGIKDATTAATKGAGGFLAGLKDKIRTPVATAAGKGAFDLGSSLEKLPATALKAGKGLVTDLVKGGKLYSILEDGMIIPGTPSNEAANMAIANPDDYVEIKDGPLKGYSIDKGDYQTHGGMKFVIGPDGDAYNDKGEHLGKFE